MRKKNLLIIFILILSSFILIFPTNVVGLNANWVKLTDWEEFSSGDYDRTVGDVTIDRVTGQDCDVEDIGSGNEVFVWVDATGTQSSGSGYINISSGYYGYYMKLYLNSGSYNTQPLYLHWYNQSGTEVIKMKIYYETSGDNRWRFYYYDGDDQAHEWYTKVSGVFSGYIYWNYLTSNNIQYRAYNNDDVLLEMYNGSGFLNGLYFENKTQYNCSDMYYSFDTMGTYHYLYLYEYGYVVEDLEDYQPKVQGCIFTTDGILGLNDVEQGTTVQYTVEIIGDDNCEAYFYVYDGIWVIAGKTLEKGTTSFTINYASNQFGQHSLWIFDKYIYENRFNETYYWNCYNASALSLIENLTDYYGEFFVEFQYNKALCYYGEGDRGIIAYQINNTYSDGTTQTYIYDIKYNAGGVYLTWKSDSLYYNTDGSYTWNIFSFPYEFDRLGHFQIWVYNTTLVGGNIVKDSLIYESDILEVCEEGTGSIEGDGSNDFDIQETDYSLMVGLGVILGVGIICSILLGDFMGFFVGAIPTAYFISSDSLTMFQCLPAELGIGLIVLLVVLAVIIWLIK